MKVGYGYKRRKATFDRLGCEAVYLDADGTRRHDRTVMMRDGLRAGDVLVLLRRGDLGAPGELRRLEAMIAARGATVEIAADAAERLPPGPRPRFRPSGDLAVYLRALWYSPQPLDEVLELASARAGTVVTRGMMDWVFGPRDGSMPDGRRKHRAAKK